MHIIKCFAEGFGILSLIIGGLVGLALSMIKLNLYLVKRYRWDEENVGLVQGIAIVFVVLWVLISLAMCGILK